MMAAAAWGAGDIDAGLFEMFRCGSDLLGQVRRGVKAMSGGHWHGGPWERGPGGRAGPGDWGGGFGGPGGGWWPGPPGAPSPARGPEADRGGVPAAELALLPGSPRHRYPIT